jgi:two-component system C4-dicarboxylate transport sensor histidine kinase DctB
MQQRLKELESENELLKNRIKEYEEKEKNNEKIIIEQSKSAQMGEMIAMIAHQWRQPLSSISAITAKLNLFIKLKKLDENSLAESLEKINEQTKYLSNTINDFRNFFKPNKSKIEINLSEIIDKTKSLLSKSIENNNINLSVNNNINTNVNIHTNEIIQTLINIIKNSIDMNKKDTKIVIDINENSNFHQIDISDNCGGIKEELLEDIFLPYFSTKDEKNGTGLGLYMSKIIIEKHHSGKFFATNIMLDGKKGIKFTIEIPKIPPISS